MSSIENSITLIDLSSPCFQETDYTNLKSKIRENEAKYPDIKISEDFVYIRTKHYDGDPENEDNAWKLWIPLNLRADVIKAHHDTPAASHGGISKTLDLIRRTFFWPGMVKDVRDYMYSYLCNLQNHKSP